MTDATMSMPAQPGPEASGGGRAGRRSLVVGGVVVIVLLLVAGGAVAAWRFFGSGGSQPADVLPADTLGVVSVDLDPSGGQKIEAIRTLRQFPSFREDVGLEEGDDPVKAVFEQLQDDEDLCGDLDYDADVAPWVGQRFAVAAVSVDDEAQPVVVVQVSDPDAAREGAQALADCAASEAAEGEATTGGFVVGEDYLVAAETEAIAREVLEAGESDPLSGDDDFERWSEQAGEAGILSMYAAPGVGEALSQAGGGALAPSEAEQLQAQLEDFTGAAATLRFDDGGLVLTGALGLGDRVVTGGSVADHVGSLPADTAALLAFGSSSESRQQIREQLDGVEPGPVDDVIGQIEGGLASVGLSFPDDLLTVLGDSLSISVGGDAPEALTDPTAVPAGVRVDGDPEAVQDVIDRAEQGLGGSLDSQGVAVESDDESVALSFQQDYADALLAEGSLADDEQFARVVPDLESAQAVLFVRFTGAWRDLVLQNLGGGSEETADLEVLRALGLSVGNDGGTTRFEARLTLGE